MENKVTKDTAVGANINLERRSSNQTIKRIKPCGRTRRGTPRLKWLKEIVEDLRGADPNK